MKHCWTYYRRKLFFIKSHYRIKLAKMVVSTVTVTPNEVIETSGSEIVTQSRPPPGDVSIAVKTFQEALEVEKQKLGLQHPKILHTLHHLAIALRDNGYLEMSMECFEEELNLLRDKQGDNKMEMACVLTNIGKLHNQLGSPLEAIECFKNAIMLYQFMELSKNHPRFAMTERILRRIQDRVDAEQPV